MVGDGTRRTTAITGRILFLLVFAAAVAGACRDSGPQDSDGPPNLVLISLDTLRADRVDLAAADGGLCPNLLRLAGKSHVFTDTLSVSPWTLPAHASMFTGLYPNRHGALGAYQPFSAEHRTFVEVLAEQGYRTVSFNGGANVAGIYGFYRGFDTYESIRLKHGVGTLAQYLKSDAVLPLKAGVNWLGEHGGDPGPFFLFLHSYEVHAPYHRREDDAFTGHDDVWKLQATGDRDGARTAAAVYDGGVRWADHWVGELLAALEDCGQDRRTLVVVTSDHGEGFHEHGYVSHSLKLYQEFLHVPLIIFDPRRPDQQLHSTPASLVDLAPTLLALLGIEPPPGLDGVDLLGEVGADRTRFADVRFDPGWARQLVEAGIIRREDASSRLAARGPWRLIHNDLDGTWELYNLDLDPGALTDLSNELPAEVADLQEALLAWSAEGMAGITPDTVDPEPLDDEHTDQLKALGYLE